MIWMNDVFVRYGESMPDCINGHVSEDENGDYNVYINPKLSRAMQRKTLHHELKHIRRSDLHNGMAIAEVEGI